MWNARYLNYPRIFVKQVRREAGKISITVGISQTAQGICCLGPLSVASSLRFQAALVSVFCTFFIFCLSIFLGTRPLAMKAVHCLRFSKGQSVMFQQGV